MKSNLENKHTATQKHTDNNSSTGKGIALPSVPVLQEKSTDDISVELANVSQRVVDHQKTSADQTQPFQLKANNTGMPDNLKSGIENLSGHSGSTRSIR